MAELLVWNASEKILWQHFDFRRAVWKQNEESLADCVERCSKSFIWWKIVS